MPLDSRSLTRDGPLDSHTIAQSRFVDVLRDVSAVAAAELRPPRAGLDATKGIDAWIDTYHGIRRLARQTIPVFLTDSAVGTQEENNLRHLVNNLGRDAPRDRVVPFLTS